MAFRAGDLAEPCDGNNLAPPDLLLRSNASLFEVIHILARHKCVQVENSGGSSGIITRHDFEGLPGRTWLFGLIAAIEIFFTLRIRLLWEGEAWTPLLPEGRLQKARQLLAERARHGERRDLLDCIQFCDKVEILIRDPNERARLGFESKSAAERASASLESLRNHLVHGLDFVNPHWPQIVELTARIEHILSLATKPQI